VTKKIGTILKAFGERAELRMTEVAQYASLPVSTAHRLIGELVECGLLERGAGGRYHVSAALHQLAVGSYGPAVEYRAQICQTLEDLELVTGYHARFGVLRDHGVSCLERSGRLSQEFCLAAGVVVPAHATAVGKALLAHASPDFLALLVRRGLPRYTVRTAVTADQLYRELALVRERGIAVARGEWQGSSHGVAAPVLRADGSSIGALELTVPDAASAGFVVPVLIFAARGMARRLAESSSDFPEEMVAPALRAVPAAEPVVTSDASADKSGAAV
jgi:DNA-binding IclR family transcriptional regulator